MFTSYGWAGPDLRVFADARIEALAIVNANQPLATGGTAQAATVVRDIALELLRMANDRTRFFYCSASDDEDFTQELAKIGKQPRREAGEAQEQPLPGVPDEATFHAAALTLFVPEHATSLRAFRKAAGGQPELAGTDMGTTVSVAGVGPLTPGVTYELWLVGHDFRGNGPESNHVSHTA